ncbi:MAG: putative uridylyltransferase [Planctomycetes bacterium ADurb.Bin126]|nr:MAG: putative uridylyltransferase [Planctomycetes bacterium ADurb.Bin126]HOD80186.1 UDPGP type 1 family protein [Phycisphaerae bacterium]HQL71658.1 UDPGP type 1 family protein [Phycisphaerae bacterium]
MADIQAIREELRKHKQDHLVRFYHDLPPAGQEALLRQIESIDLDLIDELIQSHVFHKPLAEPPADLQPPPVVPATPHEPAQRAEHDRAVQRGRELLRAGKVAAFLVAGGQGTRLGYEGPKGCFPATPVTRKPLFQVLAEQVLAAGRRAGKSIPLYVMTSPANDVATRAFFRQNANFGLADPDVFFLCQATMPAIDYEGRIVLEKKDSIALSPNGHGGSLTALRESGALDDMARRGIELISYFQIDNPLVHAIDPLFLGLHDLRRAQVSAKALAKRDPLEKLGNFCMTQGRCMIIEYSDMPEDLARATDEHGRLKFSAGSIAIHVFSRSFVESLTDGGGVGLPYHRADKAVACVNAQGHTVKPDKPNAVKLEMFVFDALPLAERTLILETDRSEEFSPIKNASGNDSPATSLHDQVRRAASWLEEAGIQVPRDAEGQVAAAIEISPLLADSAEELAQKVDPKLEIHVAQTLYLQ